MFPNICPEIEEKSKAWDNHTNGSMVWSLACDREKWCDIKLASSCSRSIMLLLQVLKTCRLQIPCVFMVESNL